MKQICLLIMASIFFWYTAALGAGNTILVIESYSADYPWDKSYIEGLNNVLGGKYQLEYFEMDTKRVPKEEYQNRADLAWQQYKKLNPILVVLGDDNALKFLGPKFVETDTPVVYLGINQNPRDYDAVGKKNITGVLEKPLLKKSINTINKIVTPAPKKILVLFDNGTTSQASLSKEFQGNTEIEISGTTINLELIGDLDTWKKIVIDAKKKGYDAMVIGLYHTVFDANKKHVNAEELLKWTVDNSPIPPFGFWDFSVGADKTIGGFVLFGKTQGEAAGEIALQVLSGTSPKDIAPKIGEEGRYLYSKSRLTKWNLTLPEKIASKAEMVD